MESTEKKEIAALSLKVIEIYACRNSYFDSKYRQLFGLVYATTDPTHVPLTGVTLGLTLAMLMSVIIHLFFITK